MSDAGLIRALADSVGAAHVLTESGDTSPYSTDWRGRYQGIPLCVVRPANTDEVARVVRLCAEARVPMVPQGGNTGLCGGATPIGGEVLINLGRLNRIRQLDPLNNAISVEAGCLLQHVQQAAETVDRLFPLSLASEGSATIGGNLSTNAGGVQVLRYGNTRDLVLGLEVVLPNGDVWHGLRALRKDNTGYDLKQLFVGAEGTLGLITAATLKLFPRPRHYATAWVAVANPAAAVSVLSLLRSHVGDAVSAFELVSDESLALVLKHIPTMRPPLANSPPWQVLIELSGMSALADPLVRALEAASDRGLISAVVADSLAQSQMLWALRENISEAQKREGISIKHDVSVPISRIAEFIERADEALNASFPGLRIVCFGHVGDGNLHYNVSKIEKQSNADFIASTLTVNRIVHDLVCELGGSISAEHGLGQLKSEEIMRYKSPIELGLMHAIKSTLDPKQLMNPGKVLRAR